MNCLRAQDTDLLERYLKGELSESALDDFEAHVLECDECATALAALSSLRKDLESRRREIEGTVESNPNDT